jgi:hypothetical protein
MKKTNKKYTLVFLVVLHFVLLSACSRKIELPNHFTIRYNSAEKACYLYDNKDKLSIEESFGNFRVFNQYVVVWSDNTTFYIVNTETGDVQKFNNSRSASNYLVMVNKTGFSINDLFTFLDIYGRSYPWPHKKHWWEIGDKSGEWP